MTELLQRIITELEKLPEDEQKALASRFLAELEAEKARRVSSEAKTDEQWQQDGNYNDPLIGLFKGSPDLATKSEEILEQEITNKSGWTWKEK